MTDEATPLLPAPDAQPSGRVAAIVSEVSEPKKKKKRGGLGRPFVKGDPRIKKTGTPMKNFIALRKIAQAIAEEKVENRNDGKMYAIAEVILRAMATSKDPREHQKFLEIAYGPVPQHLDITTDGEPITSKMTDAEMAERIVAILALARERQQAKQGEPVG